MYDLLFDNQLLSAYSEMKWNKMLHVRDADNIVINKIVCLEYTKLKIIIASVYIV